MKNTDNSTCNSPCKPAKKQTQKSTNPYKYSDSNKRYRTFDYTMRNLFGEKCAKVSLDAGFTCPNLDGKISHGGCIYCLNGSASSVGDTLEKQYYNGVEVMKSKWKTSKFIPYLQAHTNTYAPIEMLSAVYEKCTSFDGACMLGIATRADCLADEVVELLCRTSEKLPLLVELGLQSVHDDTAELINRGHTFEKFCDGYEKLEKCGGNIRIGVHLINGLPGENVDDMLESAKAVGEMNPFMIKFHLLHVLRGTKLCDMYESGLYTPMTLEDYVQTVCNQLEVIPPEITVGRVTGDGIAKELAAPLWSIKKTVVANEIDKELYRRNSFQGKHVMSVSK